MPKRRKGETLTNREKAFCLEYVLDWNATRAAIAAGYSKKTANRTGPENLSKPVIKAAIDKILDEKAMTAGEVLTRLTQQARSSHLPFIRIDGDGFVYFDFSHPDAQNSMHLIKKIKTKRNRQVVGKGAEAETWEGEWVEVELHDAQAALVQLGRHHKLFTDKVEGTGANGAIELIVKYATDKKSDD